MGEDAPTSYLDELRAYCQAKKGHVTEMEEVEERQFTYDFIALEEGGFTGVPGPCELITLKFFFEPWQKELFYGQIDKYGTTPSGLGKIVARTTMKHTYRNCYLLEEKP